MAVLARRAVAVDSADSPRMSRMITMNTVSETLKSR